MSKPVKFDVEGDPVRFTSDGMIFIEDAIKTLLGPNQKRPSLVWEKIKKDHPDILKHCDSYQTKEGRLLQTVDMEGINKLFILLPEYM